MSPIRPLEVTVINQKDVVPWKFPPKHEFMYGEWLREQFDKGAIPEPTYEPIRNIASSRRFSTSNILWYIITKISSM